MAYGPCVVIGHKDYYVDKRLIDNPYEETARYEKAVQVALDELDKLQSKALHDVNDSASQIFEMHKMILEDASFHDSVTDLIKSEAVCAEYAVYEAALKLQQRFCAMEDELMRARAQDISDISERVIDVLSNGNVTGDSLNSVASDLNTEIDKFILIADTLSPSQIVSFDKNKILAIAVKHATQTSHVAILARMMEIPTLIVPDLNFDLIRNGMNAFVDADEKYIIFSPDESVMNTINQRLKEYVDESVDLHKYEGKKIVTKTGRQIHIFANIGHPDEVEKASIASADGIGLFRTEFLYMRDDLPTEDDQFDVYRNVLTAMGDKPVIVRTIDIGADKKAPCIPMDDEANPQMGYRAVRMYLDNPGLIETELRALYRAALYGDLRIMYPMISSEDELIKLKQIAGNVENSLKEHNIPYSVPKQGIMIETPAAAMISDKLAKMVDFFSIGTNDLTQFTLAVDRTNDKLDAYYNSHHPAVMKMIEYTVKNAHDAGIDVGICGELAGDLDITQDLIDIGIDDLSVSPEKILPLKKILCDE